MFSQKNTKQTNISDISTSYGVAGFSLIELLLVISIIVIILGVSIDGLSEYAARQSFTTTVTEVRDGTATARQKTLAAVNDVVHGVHVESDAVVFFEGDSYVDGAADNEIVSLPDYITASASFTGSMQTATFTRLTGLPSAAGTITLSNAKTGTNAIITINATGLIE